MANTVEELDFRLIIDDSEFNKKIKDVESAARQLNQNLSDILDIKNKVTKIGKDEVASNRLNNQILKDNAKAQGVIARETEKTAQANRKLRATTDSNIAKTEAVDREKIAQATIKTATAQERLNQLVKRGEEPLRRQSQLWQQMKNLSTAYFSVMGASRLVSALVRTTAEFELQRTTLGAILQDVEKANVLYEQMKELAVKSPFNFKELATYAKQLSAYSIPVNELYDTTKMLADVSAGLGVGMDRLVLAYGQIRSASFLRGQEVRQLTEAGIPILEELRKQFVELGEESITVGDVFDKISRRMVPFEMVSKVFKDMTSEGGKFYQMQEVQAETLRGKLSNLKDAYQIMFSEIGEKQDGILKGSVDFLRSLADNYKKIGDTLLTLIAIYGTYRVTLLATQLVEMGMVQAHLGKVGLLRGMGAVIEMLTKKSKAYLAVQTAIKKVGNPYFLLVTGLLSASVAYLRLAHSMEEGARGAKNFNEYLEKQNELLEKNEEEAKAFVATAKDADKSYNDRVNAIRDLVQIYPELLKNYKDEQDILENIKSINEEINAINLTRRFDADSARLASLQESLRKVEEAIEANRTGWGAQAVPALQEQAKELRKEIQLLQEQMATYDAPFFNGPQFDDSFKQLKGWRKAIADILNEVSSHNISLGLAFNPKNIDTNSLDDVIKEVQNRIKEVTQSRANAVGIEDDAVIESYDTQLEYLEQINKVLKGRASLEQKTSKGGAKSQEQKDIETKIDLLKKLQSAYERLKEYIPDGQMPDVLRGLFSASNVSPDMVKKLDFVKQITAEAEKLAKFDADAAERVLSALAKDPTNELIESARAYEKYREELQKLLAKDFGIEGQNLGYDISKIIAGLTTANQEAKVSIDRTKENIEAQEQYVKATVEGDDKAKNAYWETYKTAALNALDEIFAKEREGNKKVAQEKLNDLSERAYKDVLLNNGLNKKMLSDWGDKSLKQIQGIVGKLKGVLDGDNFLTGVSDEVKQKAQEAGLSLETLAELLKSMLQLDYDNSTDEEFKKKMSNIKGITSQASKLGSIFSQLGDDLNDSTIQSLGEMFEMGLDFADAILDSEDALKDIADNAGKISNSFSVISMIVKVIIIMVEKIVDFFASSARAEQRVIDNAREYQKALRDLKAEANDGIFGDSQWTKVISRMEDYKEKYLKVMTELRKAIKDGDGQSTLASIVTFGTSDPSDENLLAIYNAGLLGDSGKEIVEYYTKLRDAISDIFSGLADDIVSNMVGAFEETGDSAAHLEDAFASMGETLVQSIMKSYLLDVVLNKYKEKVIGIISEFTESDRSQERIEEGLAKIKDVFDLMGEDLREIAPFFNKILEYAQETLGAFSSDGGADDLADGIKGITEDTANLLASYLNAIRADVSFNKTQIATISTDIKQILGLIPASPTLNDYLNQIQANTFDTAQSNREILSRIDSVLGLGNEGSALRVITT